MFAPPARKNGHKTDPPAPWSLPHAETAEQRPKTTAVQTNGGPRGEKCRDRTDDLLIWKAPHAQYTGIGATCRRVADTGKTGTRERQVYVSMYLSAPKMERTHCGRGIDIKQRPGIEQITIYTGRTDDRDSQRTVTLSHLQSGSQTQTSPTGWPLALRPARRSRINISTLSIESTLKWCCIVAIVCRHNDWQTKKSESTPSKSEKVCPPKLTMTPAQYSRFLPARSTVISGMLSADGFSGASQ